MTRLAGWSPGAQGAACAIMGGLLPSSLDTAMRFLTTGMADWQAQLLRYEMGLMVLLPFLSAVAKPDHAGRRAVIFAATKWIARAEAVRTRKA